MRPVPYQAAPPSPRSGTPRCSRCCRHHHPRLAPVPPVRDAEVLSLFAAIITKLKALVDADVPRIFESVFECTLSMITRNFEDFPEHR